MIIYYSGLWKQGEVDGVPETVVPNDANVMFSYHEFPKGNLTGRFKAVLRARKEKHKKPK